MEPISAVPTRRLGGIMALAGSLCAVAGSAFWALSGADIDQAIATGDVAAFLVKAGETTQLLVANLTLWIFMVFFLGIAATAMASLCQRRQTTARVAAYCFWIGVPLVMVAYVAWLAIVLKVAPDTSPTSIALTEVIGWFVSRADWLATILIVGIGPTLLAVAGRGEWVPKWLFYWSFLTAFSAVLNAVAMFTGGAGLSTYGFLIIPIGVGWMIAAGIVLLRNNTLSTA